MFDSVLNQPNIYSGILYYTACIIRSDGVMIEGKVLDRRGGTEG